MKAIALYDLSARKTRLLVKVIAWDKANLYVEWPDGRRAWSPRYVFENGYAI